MEQSITKIGSARDALAMAASNNGSFLGLPVTNAVDLEGVKRPRSSRNTLMNTPPSWKPEGRRRWKA